MDVHFDVAVICMVRMGMLGSLAVVGVVVILCAVICVAVLFLPAMIRMIRMRVLWMVVTGIGMHMLRHTCFLSVGETMTVANSLRPESHGWPSRFGPDRCG